MLGVTLECQRVTRGPVVWVAAGETKDRNYQPYCEGLMWEWWARGGECELYRPCYWNRVGIPGSGGSDWFRADIEYVMCFKRPGPLPWSDNRAMGKPPRFSPGGRMSYRQTDGVRINLKRFADTGREKYEDRRFQGYKHPKIANPGNLVRVKVGGGHMGHPLAHKNEAPYPEDLAKFFLLSLCPPGGRVLDPFSGSGTTASVAVRNGRHAIGFDLRRDQCEIAVERITDQLADHERPHRQKKNDPTYTKPLDRQRSMFA
jgi:hypothetical protein